MRTPRLLTGERSRLCTKRWLGYRRRAAGSLWRCERVAGQYCWVRIAEPARVPISVLSPRQRQVLGMLADGLSRGEIADRLGISVHTVGRHCDAIYRRLGVNSRQEAVED